MSEERVAQIIEMASVKQVPELEWSAGLARNSSDTVLATVANAMVILANDPEIAGLLAYDAFRAEHLLMRAPPIPQAGASPMPGPYPRAPSAEDMSLLLAYFQRVWSSKFAAASVEAAAHAAAHQHAFHPVLDWLDALRWDGVPRLNHWLTNAFDAENNRYHRAVGAKFLIAAARRVRHPGCKFDTMLVLEGVQGLGKSRACEALFGPDWFSDSVPADLTSKDAAMALHGKWCLEFAEIESLIRAEVETIKAFLSRRVDRFRPPYGRAYIERPRQCVLIGTTNKDDYLRDDTGNRRIWPVRCRAASPDWIRVNRDQLWAEAAVREAAGETLWLDDDEVLVFAVSAQSERMAEDVWLIPVMDWLRILTTDEIRIADVLTGAVNVPRERQTIREQRRIGAILRALGWRPINARRGPDGKKRQGKVWIAPGRAPPETGPEETGQQELDGF